MRNLKLSKHAAQRAAERGRNLNSVILKLTVANTEPASIIRALDNLTLERTKHERFVVRDCGNWVGEYSSAEQAVRVMLARFSARVDEKNLRSLSRCG